MKEIAKTPLFVKPEGTFATKDLLYPDEDEIF